MTKRGDHARVGKTILGSTRHNTSKEEFCHLTTIMADRLKILTMSFGVLLIVLGLMAIFLFSTQTLVPAQPATEGYWDYSYISPDRGFRSSGVWHPGQPAQPEHFEMSFPNLPTGLSFILAGVAISAGGLFFQKRAR